MNDLKAKVFTEIRSYYSDVTETDEELNGVMFYPQSLRLTLNGFIQVKKLFTAYSFDMPSTIRARHLQALSKMEYPYYLTAKRLVLFSSMDSMMIKIHGGTEGFLENCSKIE